MRRGGARARYRPGARAAALIALAALAAAGCGSTSRSSNAGLRLQREDLIATARALAEARGQVASEVGATRAAWPSVSNGLPASPGPAQLRAIGTAKAGAEAVRLPRLFDEERSAGLTGPGASIAGTFRNFTGLSATGWAMIEHALTVSGRSAASFARANSPLYVSSVYDGHFGLSQVGKKLLDGYAKLGGPAAFGHALTQAEVTALAAAYSEPAVQLEPHPSVKLGS